MTQTWIALAIVAVAAVWLVWRSIRRAGAARPACSKCTGGCTGHPPVAKSTLLAIGPPADRSSGPR